MDRGTWQATVHGVTRVGHDLATKPRGLQEQKQVKRLVDDSQAGQEVKEIHVQTCMLYNSKYVTLFVYLVPLACVTL